MLSTKQSHQIHLGRLVQQLNGCATSWIDAAWVGQQPNALALQWPKTLFG